MPKILILVLSFNDGPFAQLMKTQQCTWDSVEVEGVDTVFYYGGGKGWVNEKEFSGMGTDSYYYMHDKFLDCLKNIDLSKYTFIFRTNSSSYVNKKQLLEFSKTLPKEKLYCGWTVVDSEDHGGLAVSGAGIWLSIDTAEILRNEIDKDFEMEEDIYCSRILRKNGITAIDDKSRFDVPMHFKVVPNDRYHYRFKHGGDRIIDINNMLIVHGLITNNK